MENKHSALIKKLDLDEYIEHYSSFLSRKNNLYILGDRNMHLKYINALDKYEFKSPPIVVDLTSCELLLKKNGIISLENISDFIKTLRYLKYLKTLNFTDNLKEFCDNIRFPDEINEIVNTYFDKNYKLSDSINSDLQNINNQISIINSSITKTFQECISKKSLREYLVDTQIHIHSQEQSLLLRAGFNKIIKAKTIDRSPSGFFYAVPYEIIEQKHNLSILLDKKEEIIYEIRKEISRIFTKHISFLQFSQRAFNRFDAYQSRVLFAKHKNYSFVQTKQNSIIKLEKFAHPALKKPVSTNLDFNKTILIVTGVNAGGKTMLLKSTLSAVFLAKNLFPMQIDTHKSSIGSFENIIPVIEDPQNVKENISTFAGRMITFSKLLTSKKNLLIGVDEIELGTDSAEASSLFEALLKELVSKNNKIIVTTHHKQLASAMAKDKNTQLLAAIYNEKEQIPTYRFLDGTIGKSFAFETALRYNIPNTIIKKAREYYGKEQENLSNIIEKTSLLEYQLHSKKEELEDKLQKIEHLKESLLKEKEKLQLEYRKRKSTLEYELMQAIEYAQKAIKEHPQNAHKLLNKANSAIKNLPKEENKEIKYIKKEKFKIGSHIKYNSHKGVIIAITDNIAQIQCDNFKLKVPLRELKKGTKPNKKENITIDIKKPNKTSLSLDLHGHRADEAIDKLENFLSNAAMSALKEVVIYHGMGSGKLAQIVRDLLDVHPCVIEYKDAPQNMGGYGATVVVLN